MAKKSEFLSAFGTVFQIWKAITDAVLERGGSDDDVRRILTSKKFLATIVDAIMETGKKLAAAFRLTVNYDLSVEDMVKLGKYDWTNSDITSEHFPVTRQGKSEVEVELVHFDRVMSSNDVLRELDKQGYRPADLRELLDFGAAYPEEQRKYPIAALGSVWQLPNGRRRVADLVGSAGYRGLGLDWLEDDWNEFWRFLAVRK